MALSDIQRRGNNTPKTTKYQATINGRQPATINGRQPQQRGCLKATASWRMAAQTVKQRSGGIAAAVSGGEAPASSSLLPKTANDK